jgi:hypothetical protein
VNCSCCSGKLAMHVGEFAHPHADRAEIVDGVRVGGIHDVIQARLVPFHVDGPDDAVDQPALIFQRLILCPILTRITDT